MTTQNFDVQATIQQLIENSGNAEAMCLNFSKKDLQKLAKELGVYGGNSKASKDALCEIIGNAINDRVVAALATASAAANGDEEIVAATETPADKGIKAARKEARERTGLEMMPEVLAFVQANGITDEDEVATELKIAASSARTALQALGNDGSLRYDEKNDEWMTPEVAVAVVAPALTEQEIAEYGLTQEDVENPDDISKSVVVTVGEAAPTATPENLPEALQALYRAATAAEQSAFDTLLASVANRTKASTVRPAVKQDPNAATTARKNAGCSRLDAAIYWLFQEASEQGYTVAELASRWQAYSGEENWEYQVKMMDWYIADFRNGGHNRKAIKGFKVIFSETTREDGTVAYAVDTAATSAESLAAYKAQALKIKAKQEQNQTLARLDLFVADLEAIAEIEAADNATDSADNASK